MPNESDGSRELSQKLRDWDEGPAPVEDAALINLVYAELHKRAHSYLRRERIGHTLQTTALVHEAYLKLSQQKSVAWKSRAHFFAVASTLMRRILIDYARTKHRVRRGGVQPDLRLDTAFTLASDDINLDLIDLNEALERLEEKDPELARIVELRFFGGLDVGETAQALGISESTIKRGWAIAKAWLHRELTK